MSKKMFDDLDQLLKVRKKPEVPEYLSARIVAAAHRHSQEALASRGAAGWRAWPQRMLAGVQARLSVAQAAYALAGLVVFVVGIELGVQADSASIFSGLSVGDLAEFMTIDDNFVAAEWV
ncbi:MAG: hypothetical protein H6861_07645 [Rhodospirillales bacterium]|nr:hypothetical protein [Rhodospirillales bacterium]